MRDEQTPQDVCGEATGGQFNKSFESSTTQ